MTTRLYIYTDGGSRGNPGNAGIGILILDEERKTLKAYKEYIGRATNNQAEYTALIRALEFASDISRGEIHCTLDSELVVRQLNGMYDVRDKSLKVLHDRLSELEKRFVKVTFRHVKRDDFFIQRVDAMVNEALDEI